MESRLSDEEGLDGKSRLCEHRGSLMINFDQLAHPALTRRRSQVVRQRSAKPLSIGSIPIAASIHLNHLQKTIANKVLLFERALHEPNFQAAFSPSLTSLPRLP